MIRKQGLLVLALVFSFSSLSLQATQSMSGWQVFKITAKGLIGGWFVVRGIKHLADLGKFEDRNMGFRESNINGRVTREEFVMRERQGSVFWGVLDSSLGAALLYGAYSDFEEARSKKNGHYQNQ